MEAQLKQLENNTSVCLLIKYDLPSTCFIRTVNTKDANMLHESHMFYLQNHSKYAGPKLQLSDILSKTCFSWGFFLTEIDVFL
jgi:hypothetical protein